MNNKSKGKGLLCIASAMLIGASLSSSVVMAKEAAGMSRIDEGKNLSITRKKGNCLACHMMIGGTAPGNIAPPLVGMKARYPDKEVLKAQIYDASKKNALTMMPLFGRYEVLSVDELDKVVDYIHSL